jgi:hypothetical protein
MERTAARHTSRVTKEIDMIRHTVVFRLKAAGSVQQRDFLRAARELADIPAVRNFTCVRQVNPKSPFDYCLSMEFTTHAEYESYNRHPAHTRFVNERWVPEVSGFLELDYEELEGGGR